MIAPASQIGPEMIVSNWSSQNFNPIYACRLSKHRISHLDVDKQIHKRQPNITVHQMIDWKKY